MFPDKGDEIPPLGEGGAVEIRLRPRGHGEEEGVLRHGPELEVHRVVGDGAGGVPGVEEARGQVPVPRLQGVVVRGGARLVLSHEDQQTALADDLRVAGEGGVCHEIVVVGGLQEEIAVEGDGPRGPGGEAHVRIRVAEVLLYHRGDVAVAADQLHLRPGGQVGGGLLPVRPPVPGGGEGSHGAVVAAQALRLLTDQQIFRRPGDEGEGDGPHHEEYHRRLEGLTASGAEKDVRTHDFWSFLEVINNNDTTFPGKSPAGGFFSQIHPQTVEGRTVCAPTGPCDFSF